MICISIICYNKSVCGNAATAATTATAAAATTIKVKYILIKPL